MNILQTKLSSPLATGMAYMIARWILGISFFNAAIWKIFILTPTGHVEKYFSIPFHDTWIPNLLLWVLGLSIPFFELLIGVALCAGFRAREAALLAGLLLVVTTYGHSLIDPLYNITQGLTFSRVILVLFLLIMPDMYDCLSLDNLVVRIQITKKKFFIEN